MEEGSLQAPTQTWGSVLTNRSELLNQYSRVPSSTVEGSHAERRRPRSRWIGASTCCRLGLSALVVILLCILVKNLVSVNLNTQILASIGMEGSLNMGAFMKTAVAFPSEFATLIVSQGYESVPMLSFPLPSITGEPTLLIFTATYPVGTYKEDDDSFSGIVLNLAAENTIDLVFYFQLAEDQKGVQLYRKQMMLRTTDSEMMNSLKRSAPDEHVATLPIVQIGGGGLLQ